MCWPLIALSLWHDVAVVAWPLTLRGVPFQVDFANLWLGARAGASSDFGALFDMGSHIARASEVFGHVSGLMVWSYPPTAMLLLLPFSLISNYGFACLAWTVLGLSLYIAALTHGQSGRANKPSVGGLAAVIAATAFVPGVFVALSYGQTAFFTSAALYFGITLAGRRPWIASAIIAALACKPQLALATAPAFAARGQWRAFALTGCLTALFLAATVATFGWQPWSLFLSKTIPQQAAFLLDQSVSPSLQMSAYYLATALGLPGGLVQILVTLTVTGAMCHVLRHETDPDISFLAIVLATLNMSPYLQTYEAPLLALAVGRIVLSDQAIARLGRPALMHVLMATTLGLVLTAGILSRTGINFSPLVLLAMFVPLVRLQGQLRLPRRVGIRIARHAGKPALGH